LTGQAQWPHEEKRGNGRFGLMGFKYPDLIYPSYHILRSLVYFDDPEGHAPPRMLSPSAWDDVKGWFDRNVKDLMGGLLA
jgi:hypothetical protein